MSCFSRLSVNCLQIRKAHVVLILNVFSFQKACAKAGRRSFSYSLQKRKQQESAGSLATTPPLWLQTVEKVRTSGNE